MSPSDSPRHGHLQRTIGYRSLHLDGPRRSLFTRPSCRVNRAAAWRVGRSLVNPAPVCLLRFPTRSSWRDGIADAWIFISATVGTWYGR